MERNDALERLKLLEGKNLHDLAKNLRLLFVRQMGL